MSVSYKSKALNAKCIKAIEYLGNKWVLWPNYNPTEKHRRFW